MNYNTIFVYVMFEISNQMIDKVRSKFTILKELNQKKRYYKEELRHLDYIIDKQHWTIENLMTEVLREEKWSMGGVAVELKDYHRNQSLISFYGVESWHDNSTIVSANGSLKSVADDLENHLKELSNQTIK